MWRVFLIAAALGLSVCVTAHADPIDGADPAPLIACVSQAGADEDALRACKGVLATRCREIEGGSTMMDALCWDAEWQVWHGVMTTALERLQARDPARLDRLTQSQAAWNAWMDIECPYRAEGFGGGSGAQPAQVRCAAGLAADRAISFILEDDAL